MTRVMWPRCPLFLNANAMPTDCLAEAGRGRWAGGRRASSLRKLVWGDGAWVYVKRGQGGKEGTRAGNRTPSACSDHL
eukprot:364837-Chlamydomonas_euryale.AAC.16